MATTPLKMKGENVKCCEFRWEECVGFIWLCRWHTPNVKCQHAAIPLPPVKHISLNSKAWKPQTFSQFCFSEVDKKKKSCCFTSRLTKYGMFWTEIFVFLEHEQYPCHSSPVYLSETVGLWWIPPSRACVPVRGNNLPLWGTAIMCWAITGDLFTASLLSDPPLAHLCHYQSRTLTWAGLSRCVSLIFVDSDRNLFSCELTSDPPECSIAARPQNSIFMMCFQ